MKTLKEFLLKESIDYDKEPIYLMVKDNHFVINYNEDGFGDDSIDSKYKFVLVLGDEYTGHMKSTSNLFTNNTKPECLHSDNNWDLPELVFGTTKKSLEKCIEKIENDRYFQNYGGEISGTIFELKDVKTKINIWDATNI